MTVTRTVKGRYHIFKTDVTTTDDKITELAEALSDHSIDAKRVIYFNAGKNTTVAEIGR